MGFSGAKKSQYHNQFTCMKALICDLMDLTKVHRQHAGVALQSSTSGAVSRPAKGAGSYSGQGGRIAPKGHPGRRRRIADSRGKLRAAGANRGQRGQIVQKRHFAMFVIISFLLILAKHKNIGTLLTLWAKGNRDSHLLWPLCPKTLA